MRILWGTTSVWEIPVPQSLSIFFMSSMYNFFLQKLPEMAKDTAQPGLSISESITLSFYTLVPSFIPRYLCHLLKDGGETSAPKPGREPRSVVNPALLAVSSIHNKACKCQSTTEKQKKRKKANLSRLNPPPAAQLLAAHLLLLSLTTGLSREGNLGAGSGAGDIEPQNHRVS